jgi:hypothetical protein
VINIYLNSLFLSTKPVTSQKVRVKAIFTGGDLACLLKALYQNEPASDLAVVGYLGFIAAKPLVITIKIS